MKGWLEPPIWPIELAKTTPMDLGAIPVWPKGGFGHPLQLIWGWLNYLKAPKASGGVLATPKDQTPIFYFPVWPFEGGRTTPFGHPQGP